MTHKCSKDGPEFVKQTLAIVGDKWSALILRMLHAGPQRFTDLEKSREGISPRTLSQRLEMLATEKIIEKQDLPDSGFHSYCLTQKGVDLDEVIYSMAQWGKKYYCLKKEDKIL